MNAPRKKSMNHSGEKWIKNESEPLTYFMQYKILEQKLSDSIELEGITAPFFLRFCGVIPHHPQKEGGIFNESWQTMDFLRERDFEDVIMSLISEVPTC